MQKKTNLYFHKKKRYINKKKGTEEKPRLSVFRSHKHIYAQLINDFTGKTLACASTVEEIVKNKVKNLAPKNASYIVGQILAERASYIEIKHIIFDRSIRPYHGRIESFANGARFGGLLF